MSLRRPYAAVLQLLRTRQGLTQQEIAGKVAQSHVSQLETLKTTATVDVTSELASALNVHATTFFTLVIAANEQRSPRNVLLSALAELETLKLADEIPPQQPRPLEPPRVVASREKWLTIQGLKGRGYSQSQVVLELGYSKATVRRLWINEPGV